MSRHERRQQRTEMAKHGDDGIGRHEVSTEVIDDHMLPPAEELAKLKEVDPDLIPWLLKRTEQEQNHRHAMVQHRSGIAEKVFDRELTMCANALKYALWIILAFLIFAGVLVYTGHVVFGGIIGVLDISASVLVFVNRSRLPGTDTRSVEPPVKSDKTEPKPQKK